MLKTIKNLEDANVKNKFRQIADESLRSLSSFVSDPAGKQKLHSESFKSALQGLRQGVMKYEIDPILPVFVKEFTERTKLLKGLSQQEY